MEISQSQLSNLLFQAAELGAKKALSEAGVIKPYMKKSEAYRMFGRASIERWIQEGLLTPIKDGDSSSTVRLDRVQVESIARTSNRHTYLTARQRIKA